MIDMARIILKSPYLKPNAKIHIANYVRYVATREGVERPQADNRQILTATKFQKQTVAQLVKQYPDTVEFYEYEDYIKKPTRENADEFILRVAETHAELFGTREKYVDYIATRPGAIKIADHGLFSDAGKVVVLEQAADEVSKHNGNVWTHIISLRREDAERLGYDNVSAWQELLRSQRNTIAKNMKIHPNNFRWYAAFHNKDHHPHVHLIAYSADPSEPWLTEDGIMKIKSSLARRIFKNDLKQTYQRQTEHRDALHQDSREITAEIVRQMGAGGYDNPVIEDLLSKLADRLKNLSGKKVYGFLPPDLKATVDRIVDELTKDERISKLYDLWYEQKFDVIRTYTDTMPEKIPLSQNDEFKMIKNTVVQEAQNIIFGRLTFEDAAIDDLSEETFADEPSEYEPEAFPASDDSDEHSEPTEFYADWNREYRDARAYLYGSDDVEQDFETAYILMTEEAVKGNAFALYDVGWMYKDGLGRDKDMDAAQEWFTKAYAAFLTAEREWDKNAYLQYRLGKMNAMGFGVEQSYEAAAEWYEKAVTQENPFAAYALAGLCYRGQGVEKDVTRAFHLYMMAASHPKCPNVFAMYKLGRMYRDGVGTKADKMESDNWFERAYAGFVKLEKQTKDDKLQYRLGQMCLTGTGTMEDLQAAHDYFESAAKLGNADAMYGLGRLYLRADFPGHDIQKAVKCLAGAVKEEHEYARYTLGKLSLKGKNVQKDVPYALRLLTQSATQGNQWAQLLLGKTYLAGTDAAQDLRLAETMLETATNQDNADAQYALAKMHLNGQTETPSVIKAVELLEAAAVYDHKWAQYLLGKMFMRGERIPKDVIRAEQLLLSASRPRLSHDQTSEMLPGNQYAGYLLGKLYLSEDGILKDAVKAVYYLNDSVTQGNQWAQYQLGKMLLYGKEVEQDITRGLALLGEASRQGNMYADKVMDYYNRYRSNMKIGAALGSLRLLGHLARIMKNRLDEEARRDGNSGIIEKKQRQQIEEKKQAHGLRM